MGSFSKIALNGGAGVIPVNPAGGSDTLIHTTGTSTSILDEVWLWANNSQSSDIYLYLYLGTSSGPSANVMVLLVPSESTILAIPGIPISGNGTVGRPVNAIATSMMTGNITVFGYVNRITP